MSTPRALPRRRVEDGTIPGAVALVGRGGPAGSGSGAEMEAEVAAVGVADLDTRAPMTRESIFQWASISKPIVAGAVMMLVEDGRIGLDDPVDRWLPELADPVVVRTGTQSAGRCGARPAADLPVFPSGAGGLVGTLGDWHTFGRLLLGGGSLGDHRASAPGHG